MELHGFAIERNGDACRWIPSSVTHLELECKWNGPSSVENVINTVFLETNTLLLNRMLSRFEFSNLKFLRITCIYDGQQVEAQLLFKKLPNLEKLSFPAARNCFSREGLAGTQLKALAVLEIDEEPYYYLNIVRASRHLERLLLSIDVEERNIQSLVASVLECCPALGL